jgi:hypothetical protein
LNATPTSDAGDEIEAARTASKPLSFWVIAGFLLLALAGLSALIVSIPAHDLWWQLRTGQIIAQTGRLPTRDVFSYTARGEPWLVHEWLTELIFYRLASAFGYVSLVGLEYGLMALTLLALYAAGRYRQAHPLIAMGAATLGMWALRPWIVLRPQLFTYALLAVTFALLERARRKTPVGLLALPPLIVLWANLHAGVLIAPVLLLLEALGSGLDDLQNYRRSDRVLPFSSSISSLTLWLCGLTSLAALATWINPHGAALWSYPGQVTGHPIVTGFITEWQSPDFHAVGLRFLVLLIWLLLAALIGSGLRPPYRDFLLFVPLLSLGMFYKRNLPLFILFAAPVLAGRFQEILHRSRDQERLRGSWAGVSACLVAIWLLAQPLSYWPRGSWFDFQVGLYDFPVGAVRYLQKHPPPGPLFHDYRWGGYLIWNLRNVPVFIDGRAEVYYRRGVFDDYVRVHNLQPHWHDVLDKYRIRAILAENTMPVVQALQRDSAWGVAYHDPQAVVLVRGPAR